MNTEPANRGIPPEKYIWEDGISGVNDEMIAEYHTPEEIRAFNKWMHGQTGWVASNGDLMYYTTNYEDWVSGLDDSEWANT